MMKPSSRAEICFKMSKIEGCSMIRQEDLPFDFDRGACNVFNQPQPNVLLCFEYTQKQQCHLYAKHLQ